MRSHSLFLRKLDNSIISDVEKIMLYAEIERCVLNIKTIGRHRFFYRFFTFQTYLEDGAIQGRNSPVR